MFSNRIFPILVPMLLAGCIAQSDIQADYMSAESDCHRVARHRVNSMDKEGDTSFVAGSAFSECMRTAGWKVATPKVGGTVTAGTSTTPPVGPSTSGGVPGGSASGAAARPAPPPADSSTTPAAPVIGPGVQPDPAPAIEAVTPPVGSAATVAAPSAVPAAAPAQAAPGISPPSPKLPGEWTSPADSGAATYQPAGRPQGITAPQFGSGAGRNF